MWRGEVAGIANVVSGTLCVGAFLVDSVLYWWSVVMLEYFVDFRLGIRDVVLRKLVSVRSVGRSLDIVLPFRRVVESKKL